MDIGEHMESYKILWDYLKTEYPELCQVILYTLKDIFESGIIPEGTTVLESLRTIVSAKRLSISNSQRRQKKKLTEEKYTQTEEYPQGRIVHVKSTLSCLHRSDSSGNVHYICPRCAKIWSKRRL
ncbi:hypothetical protein HZH68_014085 [Vespula germanica]|uniref:Uncharacterized protein n=1 Tax=Vespula germanica TaxID=30212 RepID=A0A834JA63_VESGE|nr:hypothetical protein HZH68_014085 [Vespula germanica]